MLHRFKPQPRIIQFSLALMLALLLALPLSQGQAPVAHAANITVNTTNDIVDADSSCAAITISDLPGSDGFVSLREAICAANNTAGDDNITFLNLFGSPDTYILTGAAGEDAAASGDLDITDNITLTGNGADETIIDANGVDRVFHIIGASTNVTIQDVTITGGNPGNSFGINGGGINNDGGMLTITNSTISSNTATYGGGIGNYGGGTATVINSTFSDNSASNNGGGLENKALLTITNSTFSGNLAPSGGGIDNYTVLTMTNSTFSGNSATGLLNSFGTMHLAGNIFAAGASGDNCVNDGTLNDNGYNLSDDATCTDGGTGSATNATLPLGVLADNGGPTQTHLPSAGSDAIGAIPSGTTISNNGTNWTCDDVDTFTDQRGEPRPINNGDGCTAGAVEVAPTFTSLTIVKAATPEDGADFVFTSDIPGGSSFTLDVDSDNTYTDTITFADIPAGSYTITEMVTANWQLDSATCENGSDSGNLDGETLTVALSAGEDVTCTFINSYTALGTIVFQKEVPDGQGDPNNPNQTFTLNVTNFSDINAGSSDFTDGSGYSGLDNLLPDTYTVREQLLPAGWTLDDIFCFALQGSTSTIGTFTPGDTSLEIDLAAGDEVACTFTNSYAPRGNLQVTKVVDWNGVLPQNPTFEICLQGPTYPNGDEAGACQNATGPTGATLTWNDIEVGDYTVSETDPGERWTAEISGSPVTVETDLTAQVTITNTHAAPGSIYIRKVVPAGQSDPDNPGQTFALSFVDFDASRTVAGSFPAGTGFQGMDNLAPVTWTVREQNIPPNWTLYDIACESQNGTSTIEPFVAGQTSVDVDLASGDRVECTYFNSFSPPTGTIIIKKVTTNNDDTTEFAFNPTGFNNDDSFTLVGGGEQSFEVEAGSGYSVVEVITAGWSLDSATCDDGSIVENIDVSADETVTCTFTNSVIVQPDPEADLSITKFPSAGEVEAGETVTYTMVMANAGPDPAINTVMTDTLPAGVSLIETNGCTEDPNGVPNCTLGDIPANTLITVTVAVTVDSDTFGPVINTAEVGSDTADPDTNNNSATTGFLATIPCPDFPAEVGNEFELGLAIDCYNDLTAAGTYTINFTQNISLTGAIEYLRNSTTGVDLVIDGQGFTLDGQNTTDGSSMFTILSVGEVTMQNITLTRGQDASSQGGGAIHNTQHLTLINSTIISNSTATNGGGIYNSGTATLINSTIANNSAANIGGGIANGGGGFSSGGTLTIVGSTLNGNEAVDGGGVANPAGGIMTIANSTLSGNTGSSGGGAVFNSGSGSTATITNSTITANSSDLAGGILADDNATTTIANSIVADQLSGDDCFGESPITSNGHNLDSDGSCNLIGTGDISNGNANLGPLQNNGGPTETRALPSGSQALEAGDNAICTAAPINGLDQRGVTRPQEATCDIGAFEAEALADLTVVKTNDTSGQVDAYVSFTWTIAISNGGGLDATFSDGQVILQDDLPANGVYGSPSVGSVTNVTNSANVACSITTNTLTCVVDGNDVTWGASGSLAISLPTIPTNGPTLSNPTGGGVCAVDPNGVISEADEDNNTCSDTVSVTGRDITFEKVVEGGTAVAGDFTLNIGDIPQLQDVPFGTYFLAPGSYTLTENGPAGYVPTATGDENVCSTEDNPDEITLNVSLGFDFNTCTIVNTAPSTGRLTIVKKATPEDGTDFAFTSNIPDGGSFTLDVDNDNTYTDTITFAGIPAGAYAITETVPADWQLDSATCENGSDDGSLSGETLTVALGVGEDMTCTFSNSFTPPTIDIRVIKYNDLDQAGTNNEVNTSPSGGPTGNTLTGWEFTLYDSQGTELGSGTTGEENPSAPNDLGIRYSFEDLTKGETYTICETPQTGWTNSEPGNSSVADPESLGRPCKSLDTTNTNNFAIMYFGNYEDVGSITIKKNVDDDSFSALDFDFLFNGDTPFSLSEDDTAGYVVNNLPAGSYPVTETVPDGWDLDSIDCGSNNNTGLTDGLTIVLEPGEDAVCTFNNIHQQPQVGKLKVVKDVQPHHDKGKFNLLIDGVIKAYNVSDNGSTGWVTVSPGSHTVSEAAGYKTSLNDYDASLACVDGQGQPVASSGGHVTVNANDQITCTITNTRRQPQVGKLKVVKQVEPHNDPGKFDLLISGVVKAHNVSDNGSTGWVTVYPGSHTVSEAAGYKTSLNDYDASLACVNKQGQPVASTDGRVTVNANDEITCTITNTRRQPVSKLTITKSVQVTHYPVQPGEALIYTIEVANSGGDAFGVVVSDNLPAYINGADLNQTVDIPANKRVTFTIPATVADDVPAGLTITNTARFSHASGSGQAAIAITTADAAPPTKSIIYVSSERNGRINGLSFADEDILAYDPNTDTWSKYFDGSDVGLTGTDLAAFFLLDDGSILLSLDRPKSLPGLGWVDDSDIVRFIPTALGYHTAGRFEWYFDGSDVGLTQATEDIDNISFTPEGDLVISTIGPFAVPWIGGRDEDLIRFKAISLGENTRGAWERYFDGSDIGLRRFSEDIRGAWIDPTNNDIYLTTKGDFWVDGFSGDGADIFICHPESLGVRTRCTFSFYWDGSAHGFTGETIDAFAIAPPAGPTTVTEADLLEVGSLSAAVQDDPDQVDDPEEEDATVDNADNEDDGDAVHDLDDVSTGAADDSSTIYLPFILK